MINKPKHGDERDQKIKVNHGKTGYFKREKFCTRHGWIDLFFIGGELAWHRQHSKCDQQIEMGAFVELAGELNVKKAAA